MKMNKKLKNYNGGGWHKEVWIWEIIILLTETDNRCSTI